MTLFLLLLITILFFIYRRKNKNYYISLFIVSIFFLVLIKINPDLSEDYNFKQVLYLADNISILIILSILNLTLLIFIIFDRIKKRTYRIIYSLIAVIVTFFVFLILLGISIFLIKEPLKNNFEGYVFNETRKPLAGVKVIDRNSNTYVLTDRKGFFKLKSRNEIDNESNLFFRKMGYRDSLVLIKVDNYHPPSSYFVFLRNESDTLKMIKMEK